MELAELEHEEALRDTLRTLREQQFTAFQNALASESKSERLAAIEAALTAEDALYSGIAIREALASGNSSLVTIALKKMFGQISTIQFVGNEGQGRYVVVMTSLAIDPETGQLSGRVESNHGDFNGCGVVVGVFRLGGLSLSNETCQLIITPTASGHLVLDMLGIYDDRGVFWAPLPGAVAETDAEQEQ